MGRITRICDKRRSCPRPGIALVWGQQRELGLSGTVKKLVKAITMAAFAAVPGTGHADGFAGPFLAGQAAVENHDLEAMARYFTRVITRDPENDEAIEYAMVGFVGQGNFDRALAIARRLEAVEPENPLAAMVIGADMALRGDWAGLTAKIDASPTGVGGPLVGGLAKAWAQVGQGNMQAGLEAFDAVIADAALSDFGSFHKALALSMAGDLEGAAVILSDEGLPQTKHTTLARAETLAGLDRKDEALAVLDAYLAVDNAPDAQDLRDRIAAGTPVSPAFITSAAEGLGEVYYGLARALAGEADDTIVLIYARVAEHLNPDSADAILLSASVLEELEQFELATKAYDKIARDDPAFFAAELGRAETLRQSGNDEAAVEVLKQLAKAYPDMAIVHGNLGDLLRGMQRFDEASQAYDRALELFDPDLQGLWFYYYVRGITHEREDRWELAEADFRKALELNPDQPSVLNYLGYSFVEMRTNFDEALAMIEKAVELRPRDGYITDSLGWVYYRLGRYDEAVTWMEKAAALVPVDPIVNDHLGDTYWAVGRYREARFQWNRAMSFGPEEEDAERIRRKLQVGLDVVLEEEGAEPLSAGNDG